ncbi:MAG: helix-turn-helix domain-containing protein [Candidatus Tectomicrobia bacterium]|nr:helix-turn-helix domain-containing protein [Candidatus Tectomicrobia bacterium]
MPERLLNTREVAQLLHLHLDTVYALLHRGELPGAKVGGQWRFDEAQIRRWLAEQAEARCEDVSRPVGQTPQPH